MSSRKPPAVAVLDVSELSDLVPDPEWLVIPLAIGHGHDGREWLIDERGRARELLASNDADVLIAIQASCGSASLACVTLGRLRALPVRAHMDVREFVVDEPESSRTRAEMGAMTTFFSGAQVCFELLTGAESSRRLH